MNRAGAQRAYRKEIGRWFEAGKTNPWAQLRGGLVLGGEGLWEKVRGMVEGKRGQDETRWTVTQTTSALRERVRQLVAGETDDRVKIWARVKLGGERPVDVAREYGYRNQSGVGQVVKRLEKSAAEDAELRSKLDWMKAKEYHVES